MIDPRTIARTLMAGIFVVGGWDSFENPKPKAAAEGVAIPFAEKMGLENRDPVELVQISGATQVVAGACLALGWMPRLAAMVLGVTLVPTTLAAHAFWRADGHEEQKRQRLQFLKNAGLFGGLMMTAIDHGGRPSVFWATRKAANTASDRVSDAIEKIAS